MFSNKPDAGKIAIHPIKIYGNTKTAFFESTFKHRLNIKNIDNIVNIVIHNTVRVIDLLSNANAQPFPIIAMYMADISTKRFLSFCGCFFVE